MNPVAEKLLKILSLEEQRGYRNDAVIGGLDKLAEHWRKEAVAAYPSPDKQALVGQVGDLLTVYPTRSTTEGREEVVRAIRKTIGRLEEQSAEPTGTPSPAQAQPAPRPAPPAPPRDRPRGGLGLDAPVTKVVGIKEEFAEKLEKLGVRTIRDLLMLYPRRYEDYSAIRPIGTLRPGEQVTVLGQIWDVQGRKSQRGMHITTITLADGSGTIQATWFNQPYLEKQFQQGRSIILSGKTDVYLGHLVMQSPEWELSNGEAIHTARLVPIYPLTEGISPRWLRRVQKRTVDYWAPRLPDPLPEDVRRDANLMDLPTAIAQIHFPDDKDKLEAARRRLCFDEFLVIQLGVLRQRRNWRQQAGRPLRVNPQTVDTFIRSLPFELTNAQQRAIDEILHDIAQPQPMSRLLQGDVGSGKTVVALTGMLVAALDNGAQAALMAPTEILAEQHYRTITRILEASGIGNDRLTVRLLIGSLSNGEKERVRQEIQEGKANLVIGTHALIQGSVAFQNLAFVVIDEQHRFGVMQRATLREKGFNPHMLVMSATPIPRSLALTLYGDLDISVIDEMPPGRQQIKTYWLAQRERERAYTFLRKQIEQGRQAFIICPLIEESEALDVKAAVEEHRRLQTEVFPDLRLGLLHGKMRADEKDEIMRRFRAGELHILVSTSVVEVGIDIPNATVIMVEGADRFGLAQLHQFRGRVGRGEHQSYCILISDSATPESQERLRAIEQIHDGFKLAEKDLELRGPGEFFGTRQSGLPDLRLAKLSDTRILEEARRQALRIFERDPDLSNPEHALLAEQVREFWQHKGDLS
ncbi:MAG: ATP-dependent DNA helicase RecG [Anaerolineales bacterium]